jgi:hypothetical protein
VTFDRLRLAATTIWGTWSRIDEQAAVTEPVTAG